jgi:Lar family restriction alleviation protein
MKPIVADVERFSKGKAMEKTELLPCPFCGCKQIKMIESDGVVRLSELIHRAFCCQCGALSDTCDSESEVIKAWNTRTPVPDVDDGEFHQQVFPDSMNDDAHPDVEKRNADFSAKLKEETDSPHWNCRFHPTNWWHETGCPHKEWTKEEIHRALVLSKASNVALAISNGGAQEFWGHYQALNDAFGRLIEENDKLKFLPLDVEARVKEWLSWEDNYSALKQSLRGEELEDAVKVVLSIVKSIGEKR